MSDGAGEIEPVLVFRVGSLTLAVPASAATEICDRVEASPIPLAPRHIAGLMPLRGEAVPLIDLAAHFEVGAAPVDVDQERPLRVVVVQAEGMIAGLCCDRVLGVEPLELRALTAPRIHAGTTLARYITGEVDRESGVLARLNLGALLNSARLSG
jgi:purine-binding chemotaxis protein CheW